MPVKWEWWFGGHTGRCCHYWCHPALPKSFLACGDTLSHRRDRARCIGSSPQFSRALPPPLGFHLITSHRSVSCLPLQVPPTPYPLFTFTVSGSPEDTLVLLVSVPRIRTPTFHKPCPLRGCSGIIWGAQWGKYLLSWLSIAVTQTTP